MTIEQLVAQWNASIENAQQQPSPAPMEDIASAVQVRTSLSAGADIYYQGHTVTCTYSVVQSPGCW